MTTDSESTRSGPRRRRILARTEQLSLTSSFLYRLDHYSSLPGVAISIGGVVLCSILLGAAIGFPSAWVTGFTTGLSVVTLFMVFVIQHTQGREQAATQRKLDELLRALPEAEEGLMMLEEASEETLAQVEMDQRDHRRSTVSDGERSLGNGPPDSG